MATALTICLEGSFSLVSRIPLPLTSLVRSFLSARPQQIDYLFGQSFVLWTIATACAPSQITIMATVTAASGGPPLNGAPRTQTAPS